MELPMTPTALLYTKCLISLALSTMVLLALSRPLVRVLASLCPTGESAAFWLAYTRVMLTIAPLLLVLFVDFCVPVRESKNTLELAMIAALTGMLYGLYSIGKRLGGFVSAPSMTGGSA